MKIKVGGLAAVATLILGLGVGCGQNSADDDEMPEVDDERTGITLGIDFRADADVTGFHFSIRECDEGPVVVDEVRSLEEMTLPNGIPEFERGPFDEHSEHQFADHFETLSAGCYDVSVQPVTETGEPSSECGSASANEVFVVDGMTTEIMLVSQCEGEAVGAGDFVAALNHPPVIESVDYSPSKFVFECEEVEICVTAFDPNGDPMEFEFEQTAGDKLRFGPYISETTREGDRATTCLRAVPVFEDDYEFRVTVYDQLWDQGEMVRVEDYIGAESRTELTVPMYTNWDFELECYDPETDSFHPFEGVREIDRIDGCFPIWPEQFFCSEFHWDETDRTCPDGEFQPETVYPICEEHEEMVDFQ